MVEKVAYARLVVEVDPTLKRDFVVACKKQKKTQRHVMEEILETYINKLKKGR